MSAKRKCDRRERIIVLLSLFLCSGTRSVALMATARYCSHIASTAEGASGCPRDSCALRVDCSRSYLGLHSRSLRHVAAFVSVGQGAYEKPVPDESSSQRNSQVIGVCGSATASCVASTSLRFVTGSLCVAARRLSSRGLALTARIVRQPRCFALRSPASVVSSSAVRTTCPRQLRALAHRTSATESFPKKTSSPRAIPNSA